MEKFVKKLITKENFSQDDFPYLKKSVFTKE